jgi:hypothetical protein
MRPDQQDRDSIGAGHGGIGAKGLLTLVRLV